MASLYSVCKSIQSTGVNTYTIGSNDIQIETFESLSDYNTNAVLTNQENIVLIKSDSITIDAGQTLTPLSPKKSLVLFCDTLINNGTISMTGKGPNVLPHEYVIIQNDSIFSDVIIPAYANNRIERNPYYTAAGTGLYRAGTNGNNGIKRQCGSGGQGAISGYDSSQSFYKYLGATGSGYAFGGGAGSGGKSGDSNTVYESNVDVDSLYPMRAAPGFAYLYYGASGGVGNPAASGEYKETYKYASYQDDYKNQNTGVGGRIIIFCNTFINNGSIQANGVAAYSANLWASASGGASGGGAVDVFYANSCQKGTITALGGKSGRISGNTTICTGGKGGNGSVTVSRLNYEIEIEEPIIETRGFTYTGKTQITNLTPGIYEFYCRGAQGGGDQGLPGDSVKARITIKEQTDFYINVGQRALDNLGGWNGGGNAAANSFGGGGSTDIAVHGLFQDTNWNTEQHLNSRILIAKGGQGSPEPGPVTKITASTYCPNGETLVSVVTFIPDTSGTISFSASSAKIARLFVSNNGSTTDYYASSNVISFSMNVVAGQTYSMTMVLFSSGNTFPWSLNLQPSSYVNTYTATSVVKTNQMLPGVTGGGLDYVYTQDTKDSYPTNPCNAKDYYMRNPVITTNDPEAIGDGYVRISQLKIITNKPKIINDYFYTGSPQSVVLDDFDASIMTITNNTQTNAGTYNITISLINPNCLWEDETNTNITLTWTINKIDPIVTWPIASPCAITMPISNSVLSNGIGDGAFSWVDNTLKQKYPDNNYEVKFTPSDTINYNIIKNIIAIPLKELALNESFNFNYTGMTKEVLLTPGVYEFYCRGAQGSGDAAQNGGASKARIAILEPKSFYVNVGQKALTTTGGWNGGEKSTSVALGGGGSTDISTQGTDGSFSWDNIEHLNSRIIMAIGGSSGVIGVESRSWSSGGEWSYSTTEDFYTGFIAAVSGPATFSCTSYTGNSPRMCIRRGDNYGTTGTIIASRSGTGTIHFDAIAGMCYSYTVSCGTSSYPYTGNGRFSGSNSVAAVINGGAGGGKNYIYTKSTKNTYPVTPCNVGDIYMVDPAMTTNAPEAIGDGFAYIKKIGETVKKPSLSGVYAYNKNPQTAVLNDFDALKFSVTGNIRTNAGTTNIVVSIIDNKYYWEDGENTNINISWLIAKADPEVIWPTPSPLIVDWPISKSKLLNGIGTGTFAWSTPTLKMTWPNTGYEVKFTPTDTTNYNIIKKYIIIKLISERYNSSFYKDSIPQEHFDFSKLLNSLLK